MKRLKAGEYWRLVIYGLHKAKIIIIINFYVGNEEEDEKKYFYLWENNELKYFYAQIQNVVGGTMLGNMCFQG